MVSGSPARHGTRLRVWDASSAVEVLQLQGHTDSIRGVYFSPDGRQLATVSLDKLVRVWNARSGTEVFQLKGHKDVVFSACFSPDSGRLASASWDKTVRVWDAASGVEVLRLQGHTHGVTSVCFSPDGQRLASAASDGTVRVWDAASGTPMHQLAGHPGVFCVYFSSDGQRIVSASGEEKVRVWNATSGLPLEADDEATATEARAFAAGPANVARRAIERGLDTVLEEASTGHPIGRFPATPLYRFKSSPSNRTWAGGVDCYIYLIALEGNLTELELAPTAEALGIQS